LTSNTPQSICNPRAASTPPCQFCAPKKALDYLESHAVDGPLSVFDNAPELASPFFQIKVNKRLIGFVRRKMTFLSPKTNRRPPPKSKGDMRPPRDMIGTAELAREICV
jgi:hypothetical protein